MDRLCAIGNAVVGKIAEYTVEPFGRPVGYLIHYNTNLQNLRTQVKNLSDARDRVEHLVAEADRRGEEIKNDVQKWLREVALIVKDTEEFLKGKCQAIGEPSEVLKDEHQAKMKRHHQFCPNPRLRYQLSRKSTKLVEAVDEFYKKKDFSSVSYSVRPQEVCVISDEDYEAFDSRISTLNKIMDELRRPSADIILVYGIGGVGKTTLVEEVLRQLTKDKLFDDAVMVRDVKIPNLEAIQKEIAEKLGLGDLSNQTISGRANRICERIKDKKILVILDDVWAEVDLKTLGLPHRPTCKIVLTSRTRKLLSSDKIKQREFLLGVLGQDEAWLLFEKNAGDVTKDPAIKTLATQVALRCGGLPVLVITVARALENSSLPMWEDALRCLVNFDEKADLMKNAYLGLEWSYTRLNEQLKPLFLLCGTTIQGNSISLTNLLKYSMGLGFFKDHTVEEARNALYTQVDKLKSSCLLLDGDDNTCVRMQDLVHDVAIRIATRDHHVLVKDGVDQLKEWPDQDSFKRCSKISWSCCNIPSLPEIPWKCPELEMFRLHGNGEKNDHHSKIPSSFFEEMPKLKVLDICSLPMMMLPPSLQLLKINLQTLCLDGCTLEDIALVGELSNLETLSFANSKVKELPKEIAKLTHLRLLDLSDCPELEVISPNVISSLTRLEDLRMKNSFEKWEAEGDINERRNASLLELKFLLRLTALEIYIPDADILPPNLFSNKLGRYHIYIGGVWSKCMAETTFNTLKLELTPSNQSDQGLRRLMMRSEDLALDVMEGINHSLYQLDNEGSLHLKCLLLQNNVDPSYIINKKVVFPNLTTLSIKICDHLRFLFSCSMAKSFVHLKHLEIDNCNSMEEVVSSTTDYNEENMYNLFCKLETLELKQLPCLGRICTGTHIEFPSLKKLVIRDCYKFKAFICDPTSDKSTRICKEIEERESEESPSVEHETVAQHCLFNDKVRFPSLEELEILGLEELQTIWHNNQLADQDSFYRLKQVDISYCKSLISIFPPSIMGRLNALERLDIDHCNSLKVIFEVGGINVEETRVYTSSPYDQLKPLYCQNLEFLSICVANSLKYIFPASLVRGLQQLQYLWVMGCRDLLEIVGEEEGRVELPTYPQFVFPKATDVTLTDLPQLKSFYPGKHASKWPLLKRLEVFQRNSDKVELSVFQDKHESGPVKSLFPIDQGSFLNLEYLQLGPKEIWYGPPSTAEFFKKLKSISFRDCSPFSKQASILFLQRLPNLETIEVIGGPSKEIFVNERNGSSGSGPSGEIHDAVDIWTVQRVRELKLYGMHNLMHLGGGMRENSESAAANPLFPNLEILDVEWCSRLKNLESSTFQNLTILKVIGCNGLEYLTTYSVANSLVQLRTMEVRSCERIILIVASNIVGDNDPDDVSENEIAFSRLQHLTLADLPSLQGFCSGNCIVKVSYAITLTVEFCPVELKISPDGFLLSQRLAETRISTIKKIMDELKNLNTIRIGVYGIAGVGKTTLVKEVHKQATEDKELFDDVVILLDVKSNTDLEGVQKKIVEKLGMDILDSDTIDERASRLSARIKYKKILVILDDVWEQIDLVAVGLPSVAACKIVLTSRMRKTLSDMSTQKEFLLDILQEEESWVLFEEKAGDVVKDPAIRRVAKQVAKNCGGLPILVVTVASALKQKTTLPPWTDALTCLQEGSDREEEMAEKAHLCLEWSYNQLNDKELKPLFWLCGIIVRGNSICLAALLRYSMGLGFFKKVFTVEQARKALLSRIERLKDYCLLVDSDDNRYVGVHELVLDVVNRVAFRDQHILSLGEHGGNRELKEWPDKYFLEKCTIMFFACGNNIPRLPEVMQCPALTMFHLQGDLDDDSQKISPSFFEEMKNLQVLSLRCMTIPSLPSSVHFLKNLVFLCLDQCILGEVTLIGELSNLEILSFSESNVKQLPRAVGQLTHLRLLDLSDCSELEVISPGVISSLGRLEELRMRNSFNKWEVEGKGSNASLSELKHLSQLSLLEIHIPNADILPANLFSLKLERFNIIIGDVWEKFMVETTLNILKLKLTTSIEQLDEGLKFLVEKSEDLSLYTETVNTVFHPLHTKEFEYLKHLQLQSNVDDFTYIINRKVVFPNLPILRVHRCDGPSFLFSFSMPESPVELQSLAELKHLEISTYEMEESLSSAREYCQQNVDNMFSKWINLKLNESPDIIRLFSGSIDKLEIEGWIKMKRGCKEIEESHSGENLDVKMELITVQYFLFDLKAVFPNLTWLTVHRCDRISFLFSISMAKSLVELKHLEISTCEIIEEIVSSTREHGQENMDSMFPKLEDLKLNELPNLTRFCSGSYIQLLSLEKLDIEGCNKLGAFVSDNVAMSGKSIRICKEIEEKDSEENRDVNSKLNTAQCFLFDEKIGLPNLTSLMVHRCDGLSFLLLSSVARSLVKLKHLMISECQIMEAVLTKEHGEENKDTMFPELEELELKDLPYLVRFCSGNYIEFASMEGLQLEKCAKLETFICNSSSNSIASQKEMERMDTNEKLETVLFDKKVGLPKLERLTINDLPKLTKIWRSQLAPNSFCSLRDVTVQQCNGLKNIFQDSIIAGVFKQLRKLILKECVVEEIVCQEKGVEKLMPDQFFPKLACLEFTSLFQLERFYLKMPAINWPLKTLVLSDCQKVDIFAERHDSGNQPTPVKPSPVLFEKSPFSKLEVLTFGPVNIWYGRPAHEKALFPATSTDGSLPHLRTLRLHGMEKYMRLWENTEPAAGSAFPQLETLAVKNSGLTNLELSAISFRNLTILEVTFCWRLQYLTTYSVAQSLVQLKTLKVDECKNMKEIFTSEGMGEDASECEIEFSQLQHMELSDLPSLERFCSSNCSVKVPALGTLKVNWCPFKLKVSSDKVLEVDLDVQKAHSSEEACSSETNQKRPAPNNNGTRLPGITGGERGVEAVIQETPIDSQIIGQVEAVIQETQNIGQVGAVIQETPIDSQNIGQAEIMDLKQKQIVTNTQKNLQESDFGESLIEPLNANESWSQSMSMLEQDDITSLRKELRAQEGNSLPESPVALALPETGPSSSSGAKGSLKDKIRLLTAKRTADLPVEVIARLNALLGVDLATPSAYQQLSALLPVLQSTRMEWVVDQVREALQKLAPAVDKKSSSNDLVTELTARQTQLEARKSELIAGSSQVEAECHQMMGQEAELANIKQQIKTLEARAATLEADISSGKQRYSTYESSIDQLLKDREENQALLDSANRDLLQAQVEVDSTSNFIKAHLRQLL